MLRVSYTGGDAPQRWTFDPDAVDVDEAERIEAALGRGATWSTFTGGLLDGTVRARRVLLWHLLRRDHPDANLRFSDVPVFKMGELKIEFGTAEIGLIIQQVEDNDHVTPERKASVIADLQSELATAALAEAERDVFVEDATADPKESSPAPAVLPDPLMPDVSTTTASGKSGKVSSTSSPRTAARRRPKSA